MNIPYIGKSAVTPIYVIFCDVLHSARQGKFSFKWKMNTILERNLRKTMEKS